MNPIYYNVAIKKKKDRTHTRIIFSGEQNSTVKLCETLCSFCGQTAHFRPVFARQADDAFFDRLSELNNKSIRRQKVASCERIAARLGSFRRNSRELWEGTDCARYQLIIYSRRSFLPYRKAIVAGETKPRSHSFCLHRTCASRTRAIARECFTSVYVRAPFPRNELQIIRNRR